MKKNSLLILCAIILTLLISLSGGLAFAGNYKVSWWHVQKRTYENGKSFNRIGFGVTDQSGNPVLNDVVQSVELAGSGVPNPLPAHSFSPYTSLYGQLNPKSGQWEYGSEFIQENYVSINFDGNLAAGNYTLSVIDTDGDPMSNSNPTRYFNGVVELPTISSESFNGYKDVAGNWIIQWTPPKDSELRSGSLDVSTRCWLSIYDGSQYNGEIYVQVPAVLGKMFVPKSVMDLARQRGDNFRFALHLRTNDNNNRYYTNSVNINDLEKEKQGTVRTVVIPIF